jgi:hypothetical protein
MSQLPESRRIMTGRTFHQSWSPSEYDPIERPQQKPQWLAWTIAVALLLWIVAVYIRHGSPL